MVRLGSQVFLAKYGITGAWADFLGYFVRSFMGAIVASTVFGIDLAMDSIKEGMKIPEFKKEATKAYELATRRVYNEEEKVAIRNQYFEILDKFTRLSDRVQHNSKH